MNSIEFSKGDGRHLCSGSDDKRVLLWEVFGQQKPIKTFKGHESNIFCAVFDHSNRHIISCGNDDLILRYDIEHSPAMQSQTDSQAAYQPMNSFAGHTQSVYRGMSIVIAFLFRFFSFNYEMLLF